MSDVFQFHVQISVEEYEVERKRSIDELPDYTNYSLGYTDHSNGINSFDQISEKIQELCELYRVSAEADTNMPLHVGVWFTTPKEENEITFEPWDKEPNPNWKPTLIKGGK